MQITTKTTVQPNKQQLLNRLKRTESKVKVLIRWLNCNFAYSRCSVLNRLYLKNELL